MQPFDASKFNFKKAQLREVLLAFEPSADGRPRLQPAVPASSSPNLVFINVSPIEYGHVLLVPRVLDDLAQLVDASTMRLALRFAREAANPFFRVGYNSLGAYATINHLHFQAYYLHTQLACEGAATAPLAFTAAVNKDAIPSELPENTLEWWSSATDMDNDSSEGLVKVSQLADFPVRGWVLETTEAAGSGGLLQLADTVAAACIQMQGMNQPHNLIITDCGTRVFLWPQCFAEKQALGLVPEHLLETGVNPATFEVSGHMVLKRRADYESMTEADAVELLAQVSLNEQRFDALSAELFAQRPWS